jgi:hypothetical protein
MALQKILLCLAACLGFLPTVTAQDTELVSPAMFDRLREMIRPHAGEAKWAQIPWLTDLWEARKKAAAEGKPIFVWSAGGEPLGCT